MLMLNIVTKAGSVIPAELMLIAIADDRGTQFVLTRIEKNVVHLSRQEKVKSLLSEVETRDQFTSVLDSLQDSIVVFDCDWRYIFANRAAWDVMDEPAEEILGRVVWEIRPHLEGSNYKMAAYEAMRTGERQRVEEYYPHRGEWYQTNFFPSQKFIVAQMKNITEAKRTSRMNEELLSTLEDALGAID